MVELFHFNQDEFIEGENLQERFGLRGRNMVQLAELKTPIAPGFMIDSESITSGNLEETLTREILVRAVEKIERQTGKSFSTPERPLLFKTVVSPSIQIGSIGSVHTIGINDKAAAGFAKFCGEDFAYHEYRHFIESISTRFLGKKKADFETVAKANPKASNKEICALYREKVVPEFPQDGYDQLKMVLTSTASQYLDDPMNEDIEAGLMVQVMVYGNFGENSYNGSYYTRDIVSGDSRLSGIYGHNEFDTLPDKAKDVSTLKPEYLQQLQKIAAQLEEKFLDIRQVKFVIEDSLVWVVEQNPVDAKSTQAEIRTLLDLLAKKLIDKDRLIRTIPPNQLQDLLHPIIDHNTTKGMPKVVGGMAGSPGAAVARVCFSTPALLSEYRRCSLAGLNSNLILMMAHTDSEDVEAIELGRAVIASIGGYASHAPVVSRSLRKPCLLYEDIEFFDGYAVVNGNRVNEFDTISLEVPTYTDPTLWVGAAELIFPDTATNGLQEFVGALGDVSSDFSVYSTAETENDVEMALQLGAQGIGLLKTDKVVMREKPLAAFQEALLMPDPAKRAKALREFEKELEKEFTSLFQAIQDRKVIVQLLNGPLTEFLPHEPKDQAALFKSLSKAHPELSEEDLSNRASQMGNLNPMMGLRGSRLGITYPDLYESLVTALLRGVFSAGKKTKKYPELNLLIPGAMGDAEMRFIRHGRSIESATILGIGGVCEAVLKENKLDELPFKMQVGAVIELPAAALMAGHMAKQSDFFSIDTNMLTQTTNGMSQADLNTFLPAFNQYDILKDNPFQILSTPVKELISATSHFGKMTRPDIQIGLCGDHAADPGNIEFAFRSAVNFVTCPPYGVPIAKLAVAQYLLDKGGK